MSLQQVFSECFSAAFVELIAEYRPRDIAGVGAFTDDDASSIVFVAHTRTEENAKIEANPEYACDAVWNVCEWDLGYAGEGQTPGYEATANRAIGALEADDIHAHCELVRGSAVEAMTRLAEQGFFDRWPDAVRAFLVTDGTDEREMFDWNARMNGAERLPELRAFFGLEE